MTTSQIIVFVLAWILVLLTVLAERARRKSDRHMPARAPSLVPLPRPPRIVVRDHLIIADGVAKPYDSGPIVLEARALAIEAKARALLRELERNSSIAQSPHPQDGQDSDDEGCQGDGRSLVVTVGRGSGDAKQQYDGEAVDERPEESVEVHGG